jgi:hypothetical protein
MAGELRDDGREGTGRGRGRSTFNCAGFSAKDRQRMLESLERGEAPIVLKTSERTARNTLSKLTSASCLSSASPKTPVRLAFPLDSRERLFPNLFADGALPG